MKAESIHSHTTADEIARLHTSESVQTSTAAKRKREALFDICDDNDDVSEPLPLKVAKIASSLSGGLSTEPSGISLSKSLHPTSSEKLVMIVSTSSVWFNWMLETELNCFSQQTLLDSQAFLATCPLVWSGSWQG